MPNYLFEATYVAQGELHTEKCELFIPPILDVLKLELDADRTSYAPGQKGHVRIRASDAQGKPAHGSMVLTAYDKSLTYFESEPVASPKELVKARHIQFWLDGVRAA